MRRTAAIDTARLRLRPYRAGDLDALHRLWTDPQVRRYLWDDEVIARAVAEEALRTSMTCTAEHGFGHWAVCAAGHSALIGFCGFRFLEHGPEVELLYGLAPSHWGRGVATEAAHAMLDFGFTTVGFERVFAITEVANTASVAVMRRLGMGYDTRFEEHGVDRIGYVITRERQSTRRGSPPWLPECAACQRPERTLHTPTGTEACPYGSHEKEAA